MAQIEAQVRLSRPIAEVFDFFCRPANLVRVSPPEYRLQVLDAPERLQLGSRVTVLGRRWGIPVRVINEVTAFEPVKGFVDEQREGPFRKFVHHHRFAAAAGGTLVTDVIEFEPPGGLLGLILTARAVERELRQVFEYRSRKLLELLGDAD